MKNQKNITDRKQLKAFFKKGNLPTADNFHKLIDSTFNKADDKLDIDEEDGLMIYPANTEKLLSFFESIDDENAKWVILNSKGKGIILKEEGTQQEKEGNPTLFLQKGGNVGIGIDSPNQKLDVNGIVASQGRMGNYLEGKINADGAWHNVFQENLDGCHAYEVMASVKGKRGHGKYGLMHAIAISTYGNSRPKISKTSAYFGTRWNNLNRIDIRWESKPSRVLQAGEDNQNQQKPSWLSRIRSSLFEAKDIHNYNLQLKTKRNYGEGIKINYKISVLWDDNFK